jgi:hypothetical protein
LRRTTAAAFAEAAHRYSVFYQPTGDGRSTARDWIIFADYPGLDWSRFVARLDGPKSTDFEAHPSNSAPTIVYYAGVSAWSRAQTSRG